MQTRISLHLLHQIVCLEYLGIKLGVSNFYLELVGTEIMCVMCLQYNVDVDFSPSSNVKTRSGKYSLDF